MTKKHSESNGINQRIKRYRKAAGYTQEQVATILGMNPKAYSNKEKYGKLDAEFIITLSKIFNVPYVKIMENNPKLELYQTVPTEDLSLKQPEALEISQKGIAKFSTKDYVASLYESLPDEQKKKAIDILHALKEEAKK